MRKKSLVCLALCALMMASGCAKKVEPVDATARADGRAYVQNSMPFDAEGFDVRSTVRLPDGRFIALMADTKEYKSGVYLFGADGKQQSAHPLEEQMSNLDRAQLGLDGKVYFAEARYAMMDMPEPMPGEGAADAEAATPTDAAADAAADTKAAPPAAAADETATATDATPTDAEAEEGGASAAVSRSTLSSGMAARSMERPDVTLYVHRFSLDGKIETSVELRLPEDKQNDDVNMRACQVDEQGRIYISMWQSGLMRFLPDGTFDKAYPLENINDFALMPGGSVMVMAYGSEGPTVICYSTEDGSERYAAAQTNYYERMKYNPADGRVYGYGNNKIVRFEDGGAVTDIIYLSDYSLSSPLLQVEDFSFGEDESIYFVVTKRPSQYENMLAQLNDKGWDIGSREVIALTLVDAAQVPKQKEITVSVMYQDYNIMQAASAFQTLHPDIKIKVREIVPQDELMRDMDAYSNYLKKVNTEILTGKAADIISLSNLPYQKYQERKILADLQGYIANDPDLKGENYFMGIIGAYAKDGAQYAMPTGFSANYFMADKKYGVGEAGLSLQEFIRLCESLPEGQIPLNATDANSVIQMLLMPNLAQFVDADSKEARLDTPEFVALLESLSRIGKRCEPLFVSGEDENAWRQRSRLIREKVVFHQMYIYDYNIQQQMLWDIDGDADLIPFPGVDGPSRNFAASGLFGINKLAKDKDACWEFIKFMISEDYLKMASYGQVTLNKSVNKLLSDLRIELDKDQQSVGMMSDGEREIVIPPLTQADVDRVNALLDKVDTPITTDETLNRLILEELEPFLEGTKDASATAAAMQSRASMYLSE